MKRDTRGFTLMELMVVIVIVAILAAVAVPLYINYVKDAQRTEAKGAIGAIITAEQVAFQRTGNYVNAGAATAAVETALGVDLKDSGTNWVFSLSAGGTGATDGFTVTATGQGKAVGLTVTYTHSRSAPPANPWTET